MSISIRMTYEIKIGKKTYKDADLSQVDISLGNDERSSTCKIELIVDDVNYWFQEILTKGGIAVPPQLFDDPSLEKEAVSTAITGMGAPDLKSVFAGSGWANTKVMKGANEGIFEQAGFPQSVIDFKKTFEGFSATPYDDGVGVVTIGFGAAETSGNPRVLLAIARGRVTVEEANELMLDELKRNNPVSWIQGKLSFKANPNQMAALVSLWFNGGDRCILDLLGKGNSASAISKNIPTHYINPGTSTEQGLRNRRAVEKKMFDLPVSATAKTSTEISDFSEKYPKIYPKDLTEPTPTVKLPDVEGYPIIISASTPGTKAVKKIEEFYIVDIAYSDNRILVIQGRAIRHRLSTVKRIGTINNANIKQLAQILSDRYGIPVLVDPYLDDGILTQIVQLQETDYQVLVRVAKSIGANVREENGAIVIAPLSAQPSVPDGGKSAYILDAAKLERFQFKDSAASDRIVGNGLPSIATVIEDGQPFGKGFLTDIAIVDPAACFLKPGDFIEVKLDKALNAIALNRKWKIDRIEPDFVSGKATCTIYLPVHVVKKAGGDNTIGVKPTNPQGSNLPMKLPQGVPNKGACMVFTDVPATKNAFGSAKCTLALVIDAKVVETVEAISGNNGLEAVLRGEDTAGSGRPCPPGTYRLGPVEDAGPGGAWGNGLGRWWISVEGTDPRQAIGIHSDDPADGSGTPGYSLGCICPMTDSLTLKVMGWRNTKNADLIVVYYSYINS